MKNSLKLLIPFLILFFISFGKKSIAQDCPLSNSYGVLSGNNIRASIPINGSLFWTENANPQFEVVTPPITFPVPSTFFSTGIWVGAKNNAGELKLAAATYPNGVQHDFFSGPIENDNGQISFQCDNFDRTWEVIGHDILKHLADFGNNGIVDNPIESIYAYPGHQNPHFEDIHGFSLPNTTAGLAPFLDQNNDGIYNPDDGDFPLPEGVATNKIPQHIIWGVFNDGAGNHTQSQGVPLNVEVQLTAYSFYCDQDDLLNNTIFTSHKVINRGNETLDSLIFTKWIDFDLGCYTDDYIGCAPGLNTFYAYNEDAIDGTTGSICNGGIATFSGNPPVQAVTFLNKDMSSFILSNNGAIGLPNPTNDPATAAEYYNFMQGKWRDGTPLTQGGDGYNPTSGQIVDFIFPDNPNDPSGWSMTTSNLPFGDRRSLANVEIDGSLSPNDFTKIDMAYTFYQDPFLNHIETVDLVYDRTPELQQLYDNNFEECNYVFCVSDCVWTGDANRDSVVSNFDVLQIGLAHGQSGTERNTPLIWQPFLGPNWNQEIYGIDLKHADCNSDGSITHSDIDWITEHYGNFYKKDPIIDDYPLGPELSITSQNSNPMEQMNFGIGRAKVELNQAEDIYGLAYTLEFDPEYLKVLLPFNSSPWPNQITDALTFVHENNEKGEMNYAYVKTNGMNGTTQIGDIADIRFQTVAHDYEFVQTYLRIKNVRVILENGIFLDYGGENFLVTINNPDGTGQVLANENLEEISFEVFPNPTTDILNIKMKNPTSTHFSIFDIYGKKVLEKTITAKSEIEISTQQFPTGVYFLKIEMEGKELVKKFIKL